MKKCICIALLIMMMTISVGAMADSTWHGFQLGVKCEAIADSAMGHTGDYNGNYYRKTTNDKKIEVQHTVRESSAIETNRIAAYNNSTGKLMGSNWHPADGAEYPCQSNAIDWLNYYGVAGRGNTNWKTDYGLTSITLQGSFQVN